MASDGRDRGDLDPGEPNRPDRDRVTGGDRTRSGGPAYPGDRLVTIARCPTTAAADFVRSILSQAGIEAVLQDQFLNQVFPFLAGPLGGVRVQVRLGDVPDAIELLRYPPPQPALPGMDPDPMIPEPRPVGEGQGVRLAAEPAPEPKLTCPECGSTSASFKPPPPYGFVMALLDKLLPLPYLHGHWVCNECGKQWLELTAPRTSTGEKT
jgi:hypothetical protein